MPKKVTLGANHSIFVEVSHSPTLLKISMSSSSWSRDYLLNSTREEVILEVPSNLTVNTLHLQLNLWQVSTAAETPNGNNLKFMNLIASSEINLPILKQSFIIIAETSKPIYKPGELVQFRFLPVFMPNLLVPSKKMFTGIQLEDPEETIVYEKRNIAWEDAMNMSFQLQPDTKIGRWILRATLDGYTEEHEFHVEKYVLPKFTVDVKTPSHVGKSDVSYDIEVCAQYGTGKTMKGIIQSRVTYKSTFYGSNDTRSVQFTNILNGKESCQIIQVHLKDLLPKTSFYWFGELMTTVEVMEDGTRETVTKNITGPKIQFQNVKLDFIGKSYFKKNLPYHFTVKHVTLDNKPVASSATDKKRLQVEIGEYNRKLNRFFLNPQSDGEYRGTFIVPPDQSRVTIYLVLEADNPPLQSQFPINEWKSSGADIQIVEPHASNVTCHDEQGADIQLTVQSNFKLKYEQMNIQLMSQGNVITPHFEFLSTTVAECKDRDDYLGHYTCLQGQYDTNGLPSIKCHPGYKGINCVSPVCLNDCSRRGVCVSPNQCLCQRGFTGENCNTCVPRMGCEQGYCKEGDDCICRWGYTGYYCSRTMWFFHQQNMESTTYPQPQIDYYTNLRRWRPIRSPSTEPGLLSSKLGLNRETSVFSPSLFESKVIIHMRKTLGADIHVVVRVVREIVELKINEIIDDSVEIPGIKQCVERQKNTRKSFQFSLERAAPGSSVSLTLSPPNYRESHCSLRISDVTLKNFGSSGGLTFSNLIDKLIELNHRITSKQEDNELNPYMQQYRRNCQASISRFQHRYIYWGKNHEDAANAFETSGLFVLTNLRFMIRECPHYNPFQYDYHSMTQNSDYSGFATTTEMFTSIESVTTGRIEEQMSYEVPSKEIESYRRKQFKARIREFFPETWRFDYLSKPRNSQINLTVPDSMTTWNADAYCMTPHGLWVGNTLSLTVGLPFYIEPSLPYSVKKGETLLMPIKILSYSAECFEISVQISVPSGHLHVLDAARKSLCICGENSQKTVYFRTLAAMAGSGKVEVSAYASASSFCTPQLENMEVNGMIVAADSVRRDILVEHEGIPSETVFSEVVCIHSKDPTEKREVWTNNTFQWNTDEMVPGSLRVYIQYNADLLGPALSNLGKLIRMPYGCGEQNMIAMVPSIYVLDYLSKTNANDSELMNTAKRYISIGYNQQLQYQHPDGSFSAFGQRDACGSTWLTAFVLRSFLDAKNYVEIITDSVLDSTRRYLLSQQDENGCFIEKGTVLSASIKGAVSDKEYLEKYLLTAYILSTLKDSLSPSVSQGYVCLEKLLQSKDDTLSFIDTYSLSLLTFAYATHRSKTSTFQEMSTELWTRRLTEGSKKMYFSINRCEKSKSCVSNQYGNVETTAYAYLALQIRSDLLPTEEAMKIIRFLNGQRNSFGGYRSTQDTIVALKAISQFSKSLVGYSTTNLQLKMIASGGFTKFDDITSESKLVTRKWRLPLVEVPHETDIETQTSLKGNGCILHQSIFMFNSFISSKQSEIQPLKVSERSLSVSSDCKNNILLVCISWNENPLSSGSMMLLQVKALSGWTLVVSEPWEGQDINRPKLQENHQDTWNYYFDGFSDNVTERCVKLTFHQISQVENIKPSTISVTDYYKPEIKHEIFYTFTVCGTVREQVTTAAPSWPQRSVVRCPIFYGWNSSVNQSTLQSLFYEQSCTNEKDFVLAEKNENSTKWIFYRAIGDQYVEWEDDLLSNNSSSCRTIHYNLNRTLVIAGNSLKITEPGYPIQLDEIHGSVWLAEDLGNLLLVDTRGRCEKSVKFARMVKRIKSRVIKMDQSWAPLRIALAEFQCPIYIDDINSTFLPQNLMTSLCIDGDGSYYVADFISNITRINRSSLYQEWKVKLSGHNLKRLHHSFHGSLDVEATLVLPTYPVDPKHQERKIISSEECSWMRHFDSDFIRNSFALITGHPLKIQNQTIFIGGDVGIVDKRMITKLVSSVCDKP